MKNLLNLKLGMGAKIQKETIDGAGFDNRLVNRMRLARQKRYEKSVLGVDISDKELKEMNAGSNVSVGDTENHYEAKKKSSALPWAIASMAATAAGFGFAPPVLEYFLGDDPISTIVSPLIPNSSNETDTHFTIELE
jgi:hypothetical protein